MYNRLECCKVEMFIDFNIRKNFDSSPFPTRYMAHGWSGFQDEHPERTYCKHFTNKSHEHTGWLPSLNPTTLEQKSKQLLQITDRIAGGIS